MKVRVFFILMLALFISPIYQANAIQDESYFTEQAAKITQDKFHRERLVDAAKFYTDGNLVVSYNSDTANISVFAKGDKTLSLVNEYNLYELGLSANKAHIRTIEVLNNAVYMVVNEYGTGNDETEINIRRVTFENNKVHLSEPLYRFPDSFETAVNRDIVLTKSATGGMLIARMNQSIFETQLAIIGLNKQNGELFEQEILPVGADIIHSSITASGILVVADNDEIQTYTQNESGKFSLSHTFKDESLPRPEFSERIVLNTDTSHILLSDSTKLNIIKVTEDAKLEIILSANSQDFFESNPLFRVSLQANTFVVTDIQSERSRVAKVYSYTEEGDYEFQSSFYFSSLNDNWAKPEMSYLYGNEVLIREHRSDVKSAYGVLSFDDYFNFTYNRFLEKEYAYSELPWDIHYTKLVAENQLLLVADNDVRLLDTSSDKGFNTLKSIELPYTFSSHLVTEVDENTFLIVGRYRYQVVYYDKENMSFSLSEVNSYIDSEGAQFVLEGNYSGRTYGDWYDGKLVALTNRNQESSLSVFSFENNQLTFERYVKEDPENEFIIAGTKKIVSFGNAIHLVNPETRKISSLRNDDDGWSMVSQYSVEGSSSMATEGFVIGEFFLLGSYWGDHIHTFKMDVNELKQVSMNPGAKGLQDAVVLDEKHFITYDNEVNAALLFKLDDAGGVSQLYSLPSTELAKEKGGYDSLGLYIQEYSFYLDGQDLWYRLDRHMLGRLQLNRAPVWLNSNNTSISFNQGVEQNISLSNFIFDFDQNSELSFSPQSMPTGLSLTGQNELSFNGTKLDEQPLILDVSDGDLSAIFTFTRSFNYAPQLQPNYIIDTIKQEQFITIDIAGLFSDPEGHVFSLTMEAKAGLSLDNNGVLTGSLNSAGNHVVVVTAVDKYGAVSVSNLTIKVEGKATTVTENASSGGGMGYMLFISFLLVLRSRVLKTL